MILVKKNHELQMDFERCNFFETAHILSANKHVIVPANKYIISTLCARLQNVSFFKKKTLIIGGKYVKKNKVLYFDNLFENILFDILGRYDSKIYVNINL